MQQHADFNATPSAAPILVTGGTGTLGRLVVAKLLEGGHQVRVLSRQQQDNSDRLDYASGDLATGDGADAALTGIHTVIHCAGSAKGDEVKAENLVRAAGRAGVSHLVYISVVGADRIPMAGPLDRGMFGYFGAKYAAERIIAGSGLPYTTLRATQFHNLMLLAVQGMAKLPVLPVPSGFRFQPIDAADVARRLTELALGKPAGLVQEMGGPQIYAMADLIRSYLASAGKHRTLLPLPLPGQAAAAFRSGANLAPDHAVGRRTWEDFLQEHLAAGSAEPVRSEGHR